jgi:hypothetical protein
VVVWHSLDFVRVVASGVRTKALDILATQKDRPGTETAKNGNAEVGDIHSDLTLQLVDTEFAGVMNAINDHLQEITSKFISMLSERGKQYFQNLLVHNFCC